MAFYILNSVAPADRVAAFLGIGMWGVDADEPHAQALAAGDLVLVYLGAPSRHFVARAELASAVHDWTEEEAPAFPGDSTSGVSLARVVEWSPPVPMNVVLSRLDPSAKAKADFDVGVVRIIEHEYETVLTVAAERTG